MTKQIEGKPIIANKQNTVTFIKVKGTEEIIGGYNPLKWESLKTWVYQEFK